MSKSDKSTFRIFLGDIGALSLQLQGTQSYRRRKIGKNFRITPYINYAFCVINNASALLSSKTMVNSPEYCIYTSVMNTYCVSKKGFQFFLFLSFSTPLFPFFPLSFTSHSLQCPPVSFFLFFLVIGEI